MLLLVWPSSMASSTSLPKSVSAIASTASRVASPWPPDSPFSLRGVSSRGYRSCARSPVFSSLAVAAIRRGRGRGCCRCQVGTAGLPRVEDRATLRLIQQACSEVSVALLAWTGSEPHSSIILSALARGVVRSPIRTAVLTSFALLILLVCSRFFS